MGGFHDYVVITLKGTTTHPHKTLLASGGSEMKFEEESVFNPRAKFAVERAANGAVHIKSCYNNKYWTWERKTAIKTIAREPVENVSAENCTLFRPEFKDDDIVRFVHVQPDSVDDMEAHTQSERLVTRGEVNYIDPDTLVKMPKRVAFKGLYNDKFLASGMIATDFNLFEENEFGPLRAGYVVRQTNNGDIQVKNLSLNRWWTIASNRTAYGVVISTEENISLTDTNTLFEVIKKDDNVIVLRHRGTGLFCAPFSGMMGAFKAYSPTAINEAHIQVVEPLISRKVTVHKADFSMDRARIYNHSKDIVLHSSETKNNNSKELVKQVTLSKEVTESNTCKKSLTTTWGTSTTFTSGIPKLGLGLEFTFNSEHTEEYEWSKVKEEKRTITEMTTITVPPGKKVTAFLRASRASFEIPFSYTQTDRFVTNDPPVTTVGDDGVFSGSSVYYSTIETEESSL